MRMISWIALACCAVAPMGVTPSVASAQQSEPGWIGLIVLQEINDDGETVWAIVRSVDPGSPAQKAGFVVGDTVLNFNGAAIGRALSDPARMRIRPGAKVTIRYRRNGVRESTITAGQMPSPPQMFAVQRSMPVHEMVTMMDVMPTMNMVANGVGMWSAGGATVTGITRDLADALGMKREAGVLILMVTPGTPAMDAGLRGGDVILQVEGVDIKEPHNFVRAMRESENQRMGLRVLRKGKSREVTLRW